MVAAVLVNFRKPDLTEEAVRSLRSAVGADELQIIVVDNASGDGSLERLRASCAGCTVLDAEANLGFSAGCNVGIRRALSDGADAVLLFNNDAEAEPGFLAPLLDAVRDGRTVAAPKIVFSDNPSCVWYGGGRVDWARGGFYHDADAADADKPRDVTFASGCCMLFPSGFFRECGLLDESFFLYYEDAELCMRAQAAGFRIRYEPRSVVRHRVGASTGGESSRFSAYYGTRNRLEVLRRYAFSKRAFAFVLASRIARAVSAPHGVDRIRGIVDYFLGRMSNRIVVNGVFAGRRATGLERFAVETLRALDEMVAPGRVRLLIPRSVKADSLPRFRNIEVVRRGLLKGALWEQLTLPLFAWRTRAEVLSLTNTVPLLRPGIACLHDVFYITHSEQFGKSLKGRLAMAWHRVHYWAIARSGKPVFTVSEYSRRQISAHLRILPERIAVLGNGWEHVGRIISDDAVFKRHAELVRGGYFLVLGNRSPYKNLSWAIAAARKDPGSQWVVAGGTPWSVSDDQPASGNVVFTGYVSDGEMKSLVENCRVLVHPSLDEGFGIPPLEALALGRPAVVARASCLPEIYGDAVGYIEHPSDCEAADVAACLVPARRNAEGVLASYTWKNVAGKLLSVITAFLKEQG